MLIQDLLRTKVALPYTDFRSNPDSLLVRVPPDRERDIRVAHVAAGASDARPHRMQALVERLVERGYVISSPADVNDPTLVMRWEHALGMPNYAFSVKPLDYRTALERTVTHDEVTEALGWGSTCPCCGSSDGLTVWDDERGTVRWRCPNTTQTGGIVELVRLLNPELDDEEACRWLLLQFGLLPEKLLAKMRPRDDETDERKGTDELVADTLARYGLSPETIAVFGLHADHATERMAIPLREDGTLIGHDLRALQPSGSCPECGVRATAKQMRQRMLMHDYSCPSCGAQGLAWLAHQHPAYKYRTPAGFDRNRFVYNLDLARSEIARSNVSELLVVEGYSDCWVAFESGSRAVVATNGAMTPEKAVKIAAAANGKPILLVPDFDPVGLANVKRAIRFLLEVDDTLEIRVADQCLHFWSTQSAGTTPVATDLAQAAVELGVQRAGAGLAFPSHWAVWMTRQIVDIDNPALDASALKQQKEQMTELIRQISGPHVKQVHEAIRQILAVAWEPLMPETSVDAWLAFTAANAATELEEKVLAGTEVRAWIERHGSKTLKHGMRRGYDVGELYAKERAAAEFGPGVQVFRSGAGASKGLKKRNHPSEAELARELAVIETGVVDERQVRIVYVEQWSQGAVAIHDWAGHFTVLVPIPNN